MTTTPSILSLTAGGVYAMTVFACLVAALTAARLRQLPVHARTWLAIAILFCVLAFSRFFGLEQTATDFLRGAIKANGFYGERRAWQALVVALVIALAGVAGLLLVYRFTRHQRGRRNHARAVAVIAACAMLVLVALRFASLHAVDFFLYGPLKLNWVIDLGSTVTVLVAAAYYARIVRARP